MSPPRRFSTIWNSEKKPDAESEQGEDDSIKHLRCGSLKRAEIPIIQNPRSYLYQPRPNYRHLIQAGFVLLSLMILRYVYFGPFLPRKVKHVNPQDQTLPLHFSTPISTHNAPIGLFIDDDKTWHVYFQC